MWVILLVYQFTDKLKRGYIVSNTYVDPAKDCATFDALIIINSHPSRIQVGSTSVLCCHNAQVAAKVLKIERKIHPRTGATLDVNPRANHSGDVCIVTMEPMVTEVFEAYQRLGRFLLRDMSQVVAIGVVISVVKIYHKISNIS